MQSPKRGKDHAKTYYKEIEERKIERRRRTLGCLPSNASFRYLARLYIYYP